MSAISGLVDPMVVSGDMVTAPVSNIRVSGSDGRVRRCGNGTSQQYQG